MMIPNHIQISLVSLEIMKDVGHHMLIFFGKGCNRRGIMKETITTMVDGTGNMVKRLHEEYGASIEGFPSHLMLPIILVVDKLDRSPEVLEVIDLIVCDDKVTVVPKPHHYSAISRVLIDDDNRRAMALQ